MIASASVPSFMSPQEYLEWEEQQPIKYEYVNGEVFAMTGGTLPHNSVALNLASALKNHLMSWLLATNATKTLVK